MNGNSQLLANPMGNCICFFIFENFFPQWEIALDHKARKGSFNNELKLLVVLPMKVT